MRVGAASLLAIALSLPAAALLPRAASAADIAYPDLISVIPTGDLGISHPTPSTKEFDYTHLVYNAGLGPLEVQPTNYDPSTNLATGVQNLYSYDANGKPTLAQTHTAQDTFFFHIAHEHYHFPLALFGLYSVKPDGSLGDPVAVSPKVGFCLGDDSHVDSSLPHSPTARGYDGGTCPNPQAVRGISSGWGDRYDRADPGQAIDITGVPDGTYWFHSVVDPDSNFLESDKANNTTDVKVQISGDTVTPISPLVSQGAFVFDQSFVVTGNGAVSTPTFSTSGVNETLLAFVGADPNGNGPNSATVSGGGLNWTLVKRANSQPGTAEVWTASAPVPLNNVKVTSSLAGAADQSLTVYAIKGAAGVGASAGAGAATGSPTVGLTTTAAGSWPMAVANDPDTYDPHIPATGFTTASQWLDESKNSSFWHEATNNPTPNAGTPVTFADSFPNHDDWNMAAVELIPSTSNDVTPPVISNPTVTGLGPDRATVNWTTDEPATSRVEYGPTPGMGQSTPADPTLVTSHSQTITGLSANTQYTYQIDSSDSAGNAATLPDLTFTTSPPRTTPPAFSNVHLSDLEPDQATFAWTTDEPSNSQVEYGVTSGYGVSSPLDANQVFTHFETVTGLTPSTVYHYRAHGTDPFGNAGASTDQTFQTPAIPPLISVDTTAFKDGKGPQTTPAFSTGANELLVAFVGSDGPSSGGQTTTVSGAGLTWSLAERANSQFGTADVWSAFTSSALSNVTVSSTQGHGPLGQSLTVVAFKNATSVGAVVAAGSLAGAPTAQLSTTGPSSLLYGVGNDWDRAVARAVGAGQTMVHQFVDTSTGDTYWTQALNANTGPVDSRVTLNDTAPTNDRWNFGAVEIRRPISVPPPAPTAPAISGVTVGGSTATSATINWTTDQPATTQVLYGTTPAYGSSTVLAPLGVTSHSQVVSGLSPATTYHFAVQSSNGAGTTTSGDASFTTPAGGGGMTDQMISFPQPGGVSLGQSPVTVSATASSGLPVTFSSLTTSVCTASGTSGSVTLLATGTCTLQADQAGNATFNPAPSVQRSFVVSKTDQTISFPQPGGVSLGQSPVTVSATASSGLPVTFSSLTTSVCTTSGTSGSVTLLTTGTC
ncbi:MAG TPA: fibronectin type III domain-containing protein, partial [Acidimicrobiia bacterium]